MSEVYIDNQPNNAHVSKANYSEFEDMNNDRKIMLDAIIGIFGGIICIQLLFTCYVFRITIKKLCCARPIRKFNGMIQLGELSHKEEKEEKELLED